MERALVWSAALLTLSACCRPQNKTNAAQGAIALYDGTVDVTGKAVDFGGGCPGAAVPKSLSLANVSDVDVQVTSISVSGTGFAGTGLPPTPFTLASGGRSALPLAFTAPGQGPASGKIVVDGDGSPAEISASLIGTGQGGASAPSYSAVCGYSQAGKPVSRQDCSVLLWDGVLVGSHGDDTLVVSDEGCPPLEITQVTIAGADGGAGPFSLPGLPALPISVSPASPLTLTIRYTPTTTNPPDSATLTLVTNDPSGTNTSTPGTFVYQLEGAGLASTVALNPESYDFGAVPQGATVTESFQVTNTGAIPVTLDEPLLANGAPPFAVAQGWDAGTLLLPVGADGGASQLVCVVAFTSPGTGFFQDQLGIGYSSAAGSGSVTAAVVAHSGGRLCAAPEPVQLQPVPFCGSAQALLTLGNCGNSALTISQLGFPAGNATNPLGTFSAVPAQPLPATVQPDAGLLVTVAYADDGLLNDPVGSLVIQSDDPGAPDGGQIVTVLAQATAVPKPAASPVPLEDGGIGPGVTVEFVPSQDDSANYAYGWDVAATQPSGLAYGLVPDGGSAYFTPSAQGSYYVCLEEWEIPGADGGSCGFDAGSVGNCTMFSVP